MLEIQIQSVIAATVCAGGCLKLWWNVNAIFFSQILTEGAILLIAGEWRPNQ
jgi:hypothetical protein